MFNLFKKFNLGKTKEAYSTFSKNFRDKFGNFKLAKILKEKNPGLSVEKQVSGTYKISETLKKTNTKIDYIVDSQGRVLSKEVLLGEGNSASSIIKSTKTLYNRDIFNGVSVTTPNRIYVRYKVPLYKEYNGFENTYIKTSNGWKHKNTSPLNL